MMISENDYRRNHRKRVREKYLKNGIDNLSQREILEIMLFYCLPRIDTKPKANELLKKFGSISNIINSSISELVDAGLTETAALHLKLYSDVNGWLEQNEAMEIKLADYDKTGRYFVSMFANERLEKAMAVLLDKKGFLIETAQICVGDSDRVSFDVKKLVEKAIAAKASGVVIAHNHPSGKMEPSASDIALTNKIEQIFEHLGIELKEHYIIYEKSYIGIKKTAGC